MPHPPCHNGHGAPWCLSEIKMSVTFDYIEEDGSPPAEYTRDTFVDTKWKPRYLAARYPHRLDGTIRRGTADSFYVRWFQQKPEFSCADTVSVTSLVRQYVGFDSQKPDAPQPQTDNRLRGIELHHMIECFLNGFSPDMLGVDNCPVRDDFRAFLSWWERFEREEGASPFRTEFHVRSSAAIRVVGIIDALFWLPEASNGTDTLHLIIVDWKCSASTTGREYHAQINLYGYLLEEYYTPFVIDGHTFQHVCIDAMYVVRFHGGACHVENVADGREDTLRIIECRTQEMSG